MVRKALDALCFVVFWLVIVAGIVVVDMFTAFLGVGDAD